MPIMKWKFWVWDKADEGMKVVLVELDNVQHTFDGVVSEVKRSDKCRMIDRKPVKSSQVSSVTIECSDGKKIIVTRSNPQYQIILQ